MDNIKINQAANLIMRLTPEMVERAIEHLATLQDTQDNAAPPAEAPPAN